MLKLVDGGANEVMGNGSCAIPFACGVALKEWAVFVSSLEQGDQVLLLRKGGIREEGKDFRPIHPEFLLYPTYEHQRQDLLKDPYIAMLRASLTHKPARGSVIFTHWAKVEEVIELYDEQALGRLDPFHIWSQDYARKRLSWKPLRPLTLMILRVYRLSNPKVVDYQPAYGGCRSWVHLESEVSLGEVTPVLSQDAFSDVVTNIKRALDPLPI